MKEDEVNALVEAAYSEFKKKAPFDHIPHAFVAGFCSGYNAAISDIEKANQSKTGMISDEMPSQSRGPSGEGMGDERG